MSQYKKDIDRLYNRVVRVVSRGESYLQNYYDLIDEVISYGQSELLQDVYIRKFKIDTTRFATIDALKKNTFAKVAYTLQTKSNVSLQSLYSLKNVFPLGTQYFDIITGNYLGDIKQFDSTTFSQGLEVTTFYPLEMKSAIPNFPTKVTSIIEYKNDFVIYFQNQLYMCINSYTWSYSNQITPTFSNYWAEVVPGTQSYTPIVNQSITLVERYSQAIDILRKYNYFDSPENSYIDDDYVDNYFDNNYLDNNYLNNLYIDNDYVDNYFV